MMRSGDTNLWREHPVLVTGGASFIGSHLVDRLVELGARVRVVDNLSSGSGTNIKSHLSSGSIEFLEGDLLDPRIVKESLKGIRTVFHLAADHGGRGYVDRHPVECSTNMILDGQLFMGCRHCGVEKVVYASSGCVYPNHMQTNVEQELFLHEDLVQPPYDSDNLYGWAKLMGELTLQAYRQQYGIKVAICRYFTVYGPRAVENHSVVALIARAFVRANPFEVWGTGEQLRNWTYIDDIVAGTLAAAERIDDGTAVNLGTMERVRVMDAVKLVLALTGHRAEIVTLPHMPTGPLNRVSDNHRAAQLLEWQAQVPFAEGLRRTIEWYFQTKDVQKVREVLDRMLMERGSYS